jgi:hypothetical protein
MGGGAKSLKDGSDIVIRRPPSKLPECCVFQCAKVYPKYSGLVQPSMQLLWQREATVDDRATMSSESACQVARSWVYGGSFHTRLVVRFMIFTSVRHILETHSFVKRHGSESTRALGHH